MRRYLKWVWYILLAAVGILRLAAVPKDFERAKEILPWWEELWLQATASDALWWIILAVLGLGALAFDIIPFLRKQLKIWQRENLEIVYDPADEQGQFGGVGLWYTYGNDEPPLEAFIFRIGVKNNTQKTIYEVVGTVEGDLVQHAYPVALRFSRTRELEGTLHPKRMLLMDIFALHPHPDNWPDGVHTLIIRVNGRDTSEAMKRVYFDKSRMPAMYLDE